MSWDKQTVNKSNLDATKELLEEIGIPYTVEVRGYVDDRSAWSEEKIPLRKLIYKDKIIVEQMIRVPDCDSDDVIISVKVNKNEYKEEIPLEQTVEESV